MVDRRGAEPLEPSLGDSPLLREVGGDPVVEETPSLCVDLRRARMASGRELSEVATALRIRLIYLEALEEGRFDDLPGATYTTGFLRTYSEFLGIDPDEMVERLKRETATGDSQRDLTFPVPPKEGRNPKPWLILVVLVVAGLAYGGWHVYSTNGQVATEIVSDVSSTLTEAAGLSDDEAVMAEVATEPVAIEEEAAVAPAETSSTVATNTVATASEPEAAPAPEAAPEPVQAAGDTLSDGAAGTAVAPEQTAAVDDSAWMSEATDVGETQAVPQETTAPAVESEAPAAAASVVEDTAPAQAATPSDPPLSSDSLWDNSASNTPSETAIIVEASAPESSEAPIIRNANARALDETNADDIAATPESTGGTGREPSVYGEENADFRIAITATADSWVQIQGPNNELVLTRILRTGDIYQVPNRSGLLMVTGNAGALELRVDGNLVGSLGPVGVVRRNVSLDPETLAANTMADSQQ